MPVALAPPAQRVRLQLCRAKRPPGTVVAARRGRATPPIARQSPRRTIAAGRFVDWLAIRHRIYAPPQCFNAKGTSPVTATAASTPTAGTVTGRPQSPRSLIRSRLRPACELCRATFLSRNARAPSRYGFAQPPWSTGRSRRSRQTQQRKPSSGTVPCAITPLRSLRANVRVPQPASWARRPSDAWSPATCRRPTGNASPAAI